MRGHYKGYEKLEMVFKMTLVFFISFCFGLWYKP